MDHQSQLNNLIRSALQEDIGDGDHSTLSCIDPDAKGKAVLKIKENGILAGMNVAEQVFRFLQPDMGFVPFKKDGDAMKYGEIAFEATANVAVI